jgi:hypothetical protein
MAAKPTMAVPRFGTVGPLDGRPIFAMTLTAAIPPSGTVCPLDSGTMVAVEKAMPNMNDVPVSSVTAIGNSALWIVVDKQASANDRGAPVNGLPISWGDFAVAFSHRLKDSTFAQLKGDMRHAARITQ